MNHQIDHGNAYHGLTAFGECFVVFGQSAVPTQPGERSFHDPSLGQNFKGVHCSALDDLNDPAIPPGRPVHEASGIPAVGEDEFQSPESSSQALHQQLAAIAVLDVGGVHDQGQDQAQRVDQQMPLAPLDFLARVVPPRPPFSAVLTDWLSIMPTEGVGFFPAFRRTWARRRS
jgi:hypothetical protein